MSYADKVRAAGGVQQALLVIAEGIDAILAQAPAAAPADPWGSWTPQPAPIQRTAERDQLNHDAMIAELQRRLAVEGDGEERLALEARLRLLTDDGVSVQVGPQAGTREHHDDGVVVIPPATPERQADRIQWAHAHQLDQFSTLPPEEFYPAYGKGGPMWMYAGNRDGVMQMPDHLRVALVNDVMQDSDAAAQEMARDILKDTSTGVSPDVAVQGLIG